MMTITYSCIVRSHTVQIYILISDKIINVPLLVLSICTIHLITISAFACGLMNLKVCYNGSKVCLQLYGLPSVLGWPFTDQNLGSPEGIRFFSPVRVLPRLMSE